MVSMRMRVAAMVVRLTRKPTFATEEAARRRMAEPKRDPTPPKRLGNRHQIDRHTVGDFDCYRVRPRDHVPRRAVMYLHGGSYVSEIAPQHWAFVDRLATAGCHVEVPIYGLAPQHNHREAVPFVVEVYRRLLEDHESSEVVFAGDSAGGGLALAVAQALDANTPQPRRLVLISPAVDMTMSNPETMEVERRDPWLARAGVIVFGEAWADGDDVGHPGVSPLYGDVSGLAPISVVIGTHDILYPDVLRFRDRCAEAGVDCSVTAVPGAFHDFPLAPVPEGRRAVRDLIATIAEGEPIDA